MKRECGRGEERQRECANEQERSRNENEKMNKTFTIMLKKEKSLLEYSFEYGKCVCKCMGMCA